MNVSKKRYEIRRLRYRAEQWRIIMNNFSDARTIAALAATAAELDPKADVLTTELAAEDKASGSVHTP